MSKFQEWLKDNTDLAASTINLYRKVVNQLEEFLGTEEDSIDRINAFLAKLGRKSMYYAKFAIMKYLEWKGRAEEKQQLIRMRTPRGRKRAINILSNEQYSVIVRSLRGIHHDVFMLCFWTGLRAGEALQLRRKNIAYNDAKKAYIISLRGKGQKGGVVAYGIERREDVLDKYVHLRPQDYLFLTPDCVLEDEHGLRPRLATAYNRYLEAVREAGRLVGIHNLGTHDARRTFGTRIRLRKDLVAAKRALRHADIQTTMRYIGDDDETEAITAMLDFQKET